MIGVGPTEKMSLRVSVASLARVVILSPDGNGELLVLERKATFHHDKNEPHATVHAQPLGGAVSLLDPRKLLERIDGFNFDGQRSQLESDLRIYIRPSDWEVVRNFCVEQLQSSKEDAIELSPIRELEEEFNDALGVEVNPDSFLSTPLWTVIENSPALTRNLHAADRPTVRIYRVFDVQVKDIDLVEAIIENSNHYSDDDLREIADQNAPPGEPGRANSVLVLPVDQLVNFFQGSSAGERNQLAEFDGHILEPNVTVLFEGIWAARYRRVRNSDSL